jgi:hypothetical protein
MSITRVQGAEAAHGIVKDYDGERKYDNDLTEKIVVAVRQRRGCGVERVVAVKQRQGTGGRMDVGYGVLCVKHGGGRK